MKNNACYGHLTYHVQSMNYHLGSNNLPYLKLRNRNTQSMTEKWTSFWHESSEKPKFTPINHKDSLELIYSNWTYFRMNHPQSMRQLLANTHSFEKPQTQCDHSKMFPATNGFPLITGRTTGQPTNLRWWRTVIQATSSLWLQWSRRSHLPTTTAAITNPRPADYL